LEARQSFFAAAFGERYGITDAGIGYLFDIGNNIAGFTGLESALSLELDTR
jgi:hypothetical protein